MEVGHSPEGLSMEGEGASMFFSIIRTSEPCERENFAMKEID